MRFAILSTYIDLIKNMAWDFLGNCHNMKIDYSGGPFFISSIVRIDFLNLNTISILIFSKVDLRKVPFSKPIGQTCNQSK